MLTSLFYSAHHPAVIDRFAVNNIISFSEAHLIRVGRGVVIDSLRYFLKDKKNREMLINHICEVCLHSSHTEMITQQYRDVDGNQKEDYTDNCSQYPPVMGKPFPKYQKYTIH